MPEIRCDEDEMNAYSEIIKDNIEFGVLLERYPYDRDLVTGIFELILETVMVKGDRVLIVSNQYPRKLVKSKLSMYGLNTNFCCRSII